MPIFLLKIFQFGLIKFRIIRKSKFFKIRLRRISIIFYILELKNINRKYRAPLEILAWRNVSVCKSHITFIYIIHIICLFNNKNTRRGRKYLEVFINIITYYSN